MSASSGICLDSRQIREYAQNMDPADAVAKVIRDIPENFILKKFLMIHQAEVLGMLLTEYNETEAMRLFKLEGREEGRELAVTTQPMGIPVILCACNKKASGIRDQGSGVIYHL